MSYQYNSNSLLSQLLNTPRRKIFVSYHHDGDQLYYDSFTQTFAGGYDVIYDNSLDRIIDSNNVDYVLRRIRENYINGSSCTIVLCGSETPWRKYVDWEIKATLDAEHGLIGVNLPSNPQGMSGKFTVPDRLHDNIHSGYAVWTNWASITQGTDSLRSTIELAVSKSTRLIDNSRVMMSRNGTSPMYR